MTGQLGYDEEKPKAFFHTLAALNNSNAACYVIQSKKYKQI